MFKLLLSISLLFTLSLWKANVPEETNEDLRMKVESLKQASSPMLAGEKVYSPQALHRYYLQDEFDKLWSDSEVQQIIHLLSEAPAEGLNPQDYHLPSIQALAEKKNALNEAEKIQLELLLTDGLLLYLSHLQSGKIDPRTTDANWKINKREVDPVSLLNQVSLEELVDNNIPAHPAYRHLRTELKRLTKEGQASANTQITSGEALKKGMRSHRVQQLKQRLAEEQYFSGESNELFDEELEEAVMRFQQHHHLEADGVAGRSTLRLLNLSREEKMNLLKVNMERWRWLPQEFADFRIQVNIADYKLKVIDQNEVIREHKVIVGKPYRKTPVFYATMSYLVFSPTWTIPLGILKGDVIPAMQKNEGYLQKKNIAVFDQQGNKIDPAGIDWSSTAARSYTYRQPAGADNALGDVKFMFPNEYAVYLHDTPSRELFNRSDRSFSSGCIRVEKPLELAEYLLNDPEKWNKVNIDQLIKKRQTTTAYLQRKPEVYLLYLTAFPDEEGKIVYRQDIYERDGMIMAALDREN
jgi:murein L,D-transpeptidase YcbB/YkuD